MGFTFLLLNDLHCRRRMTTSRVRFRKVQFGKCNVQNWFWCVCSEWIPLLWDLKYVEFISLRPGWCGGLAYFYYYKKGLSLNVQITKILKYLKSFAYIGLHFLILGPETRWIIHHLQCVTRCIFHFDCWRNFLQKPTTLYNTLVLIYIINLVVRHCHRHNRVC